MRLFRFLVIFLALSVMFAACGTDEEEDVNGGEGGNGGNSGDNSGSGDENGDGEQNNATCGNKITETGEVCDGNANECTSIDAGYTGGYATCNSDCTGWNVSGCQGTPNGTPGDGGNGNGNGDSGNGNGDGGNGDGTASKEGIWVDPKPFPDTDIHLMWENPMTYTAFGGVEPSHADSVTYCENLVLAGHDDWRLPKIDELRTLVRGISTIEYGGKCPTSENCTDQKKCADDEDNSLGFGNSCLGCEALNKEDPSLSYLNLDEDCQLTKTQLDNNECYIVKAMHGDPCDGTWSSTKNTSTAGAVLNAFWYLNYKSGIIKSSSDTLQIANWVRCVREGTAADVTEEEEEEATNPEDWECKTAADCTDGKYCDAHKCVAGTYTAANGLEWQNGTINETLNKWSPEVERVAGWAAAKAYCENLDYAGHDDWRLPDIDELKSLVKGCDKTNQCAVTAENPGYNESYIPTQAACKGCSSGNYLPAELGEQIQFSYWSSTTDDPTKGTRVYVVDFKTAAVVYDYSNDSANHYARCVRGSMN